MNAKATRMLFTAVALSALAVVLASSAQARIAECNGTQPPSRTVVTEQQSPQGSRTFFVDPEIYAALTSSTVVNEQQASQGTELLEPRLARQRSGTVFVDAEICANLDLAIRLAIQQCLSHPVPLAAKQIRGQAQSKTFHDYRGHW